MSNVAPPTATIGDVYTILDASGLDVYDGRAPQGVIAPFITVTILAPNQLAAGLAAEDWGRLESRYQVAGFGESPAQADWVRGQALAQFTTDQWQLEPDLFAFEDTTAAPTAWVSGFIVREVQVAIIPVVPFATLWNDAGDAVDWNETGDNTLWTG